MDGFLQGYLDLVDTPVISDDESPAPAPAPVENQPEDAHVISDHEHPAPAPAPVENQPGPCHRPRYSKPSERDFWQHDSLTRKMRAAKARKRERNQAQRFMRATPSAIECKAKTIRGKKITRSLKRWLQGLMKWATEKTDKRRRSGIAPASDDVDASFSVHVRCADVASATSKDGKGVRLSEKCVAFAIHSKVLDILKSWEETSAKLTLQAAHKFIGFDTATHRLRVDFELTESGIDLAELSVAGNQPWHTTVVIRGVVLVFAHATVELNVPCSVLPCEGTGAGAMEDTLWEAPMSKAIQDGIDAIANRAPIITDNWGIDGHFGNEKLFALHETTTHESGACGMVKSLCMNHRAALIEQGVKDVEGEDRVNSVFSTAKFMRGGCFLLRMCGVVLPVMGISKPVVVPIQRGHLRHQCSHVHSMPRVTNYNRTAS